MPVPLAATHLSPFDLTLVALYLVAITIFGLRFSKRATTGQSLKSYFLADNVIPWWAIALSIVSAETSTLTIVSIPGVAFAGNFGFLQVVLGYMLGRIVVAALFLPRYFQGAMLTAYQLIDQRFGPVLHKVTAGLFLLTRAAAEGVRVFAISIVVGIAIGTGDTLSIAIISALTLLYTFEGGMAAVIWTDVVQMALYIGGTVVALITLGHQVPGGWSAIHALAAPAHKFTMLNFAFNLTSSYTFWAGVLGGTFLTMASHGTDQLMVQRMLAARSLRESRLALLSSGAVIFVQFTLFLLIGAGLWVFYGQHPATFRTNDYIFPTFIVRQMPHGIAGLLVAAILAAAMSNLSAALNSLSSTTVVDFYMHLRPHAADRERTVVSRVSTVLWAVVLFAIAVYSVHAGGKGHVVETGLSIASVAYGALLGVFLLGTLTRYATQWGAIVGMVCGFAFNLVLWLYPGRILFSGYFYTPTAQEGWGHPTIIAIPHIAFTWYVFLGAIVTFAIGSAASLILPKPRRQAVTALAVVLLLMASPLARAQAYNFAPVSDLINTAIAQKKLPGAIAVIGHNGKVVFEQAYGVRKLAGEPGPDGNPSPAEPMTEDTVFDMASLSKVLVTTTAVMQLVEQHKLDLDTPVARYLPAFAQNGKDRITIRQLLTHYSGLPEDVDLKDAWGLAAPDKAEGIRRAMAAIPYGPPGLTFKYSDINFITLGALVEVTSGLDLDVYAQQKIFLPLGMIHTTYHPLSPPFGSIVVSPSQAAPNTVAIASSTVPADRARPAISIADVAPTAHDDEGTAATNSDFGRLLRGTVHDPTTRRMGGVAGHAGVFSTAHDASLFAQALLDRLLHNTGPFPLSQRSLQLMTIPNEPPTAQTGATIFTPDGQPTKGVASHGLGWDINTAFSRPRGEIFPISTTASPGSFGHTGFTGTSLWLDPASNTYVILLANSIHPKVGASISPLRGQVATAAARALGLGPNNAPPDERSFNHLIDLVPAPTTLTGIDVLEQTHFAALHEAALRHGGQLRIGLLTNQSGLDAQGRRTVDVLAHALPEIQLTTLFSPEHGLYGRQDTEHLAAEQDPLTHLPVISLYGPKPSDKHPKPNDLDGLDAVVIDLQDAGVRFWTYETLVGYFLEAASHAHLEIILLDRPNPIAGAVEGPISDYGFESIYTDFMPIPVRHGLTLGELARYFNANASELPITGEIPATKPAPGLHAQLTVVPMRHWTHAMFWDETGLPWTNPSPNLKSPAANVLYPGIGMAEQTNISIGRGTATPFEHLGAPWIDARQLADYLTARQIPGIAITPTTLTVAEDQNHYPSHGQTIPGIAFRVTDRNRLDSCELGLEIIAALHKLYPAQFRIGQAKNLIANAATLAALTRGDDPRAINATFQPALQNFRTQTRPYRMYP
ncbi:sodium/solute symporter [Granulicella sp. WH15]|uniref:sodium:solute symporter family transporter n=1 Tax=Granulicella sp. WH15 TaxID=2602070 RepID=UPI001366E492|nr:sodium/solute symporter [Granulicella sp. WH15]QHN03875.1 sodium/solute symporter [Granulicella sp. WH15]